MFFFSYTILLYIRQRTIGIMAWSWGGSGG